MKDKMNPTHIRNEQPVTAWQWDGTNEAECPWEYEIKSFGKSPKLLKLLVVSKSLIEAGSYIVDGLPMNRACFEAFFSPIPQSTEPLTVEDVRKMLECVGGYKNFVNVTSCNRVIRVANIGKWSEVSWTKHGTDDECVWIMSVDFSCSAEDQQRLLDITQALNANGFNPNQEVGDE